MHVVFHLLGVGNAFLREVGCLACPQCSAEKARAATAAALVVKAGREVRRHVLFDCGPGVADGLVGFGLRRLDATFNSHRHLDHIAEYDRVLSTIARTTPGAAPVPFHATAETWRHGLAWSYPWLRRLAAHVALAPGVAVELGYEVGLRVTPVPVFHGPWVNDPVVFVVEFGRGDTYRKIVLMWDWLHLVTRHPAPVALGPALADSCVPAVPPTGPGSAGYPTDDYPADREKLYAGLTDPAAALGPDELLPEHAILKDADEFFVAANTVTPQPQTGHASLRAGLHLVRRARPKRAWVLHYSGHEDPGGPLSDAALQDWIDREKGGFGLGGTPVGVAPHGLTLTWAV